MVSLTHTRSSSKSIFKGSKKAFKHTPLFDIRLDTPDKDVLLLKGPPDEAAPVLLSGVVVMSVIDPITVKKLTLQMYATLDMHWDEKYKTGNGSVFKRPLRNTRVIFNFEWDPLNLQDFLARRAEAKEEEDQMDDNDENAYEESINAGDDNISSIPMMGNNSTNGSGVGSVAGSIVETPGGSHEASRMGSHLGSRVGSYSSLMGFVTGHQAGSHSSSYSSLASLPSVNAANSINATNSPAHHNKSSSSLVGLAMAAARLESTVLQPGNYEFPFRTILQGSIPESIDGLHGCSLVYRLQSVLERGRFTKPIITRKLIHVIRTIRSDASELSETVAVDNTWPGKVDYSISVPARAIAVGSKCDIEIIIVPLLKGLRLGNIKIKLAEYSSLVCSASSHSQERHIISKSIKKVTQNSSGKDIWTTDVPADSEGVFYRSPEIVLSEDRWNIQTQIQIPTSLAHICQDCDIKDRVKVRHKFKFSIGLINPDGHVSELRATLPITIFVSPFITVASRGLNEFLSPFSLSGYEDATLPTPMFDTLFPNAAEVSGSNSALASTLASGATSPRTEGSPISVPFMNTQQLMAPPRYEHRIFDRLYDSAQGIPEEDEDQSQQQQQQESSLSQSYDDIDFVPADHTNVSHLYANLGRGSAHSSGFFSPSSPMAVPSSPLGQRPPAYPGSATPHSAVGSSTQRPSIISGPSFQGGMTRFNQSTSSSIANLSALNTPQIGSPPIQYLSRVTTAKAGEPGSADTEKWNPEELSRVPSYETAIKSDLVSIEPTPVYQPPAYDSNINLALLDSRLEDMDGAEHRLAPVQSSNSSSSGKVEAYQPSTPGQSTKSPNLIRSRSAASGTSSSIHALSPKFGSTTSLLSKQFHKLQRFATPPHPQSSKSTSHDSRPNMKRSKSSLSFKFFHRH